MPAGAAHLKPRGVGPGRAAGLVRRREAGGLHQVHVGRRRRVQVQMHQQLCTCHGPAAGHLVARDVLQHGLRAMVGSLLMIMQNTGQYLSLRRTFALACGRFDVT